MRNQNKLPSLGGLKSKNKVIYCIIIVILTAIALISGKYSLYQQETTQTASNQDMIVSDAAFQVHVIDVGQGDSILVCADGESMLIDAAESSSAEAILAYLSTQNITELDYAIATHMHADHIGGYPDILQHIRVNHIFEPVCPDNLIPTTKTYENYLNAVETSGAEYRTLQAGDSFTLGNASVTVLAPVSMQASSLNNTSLVLRVQYEEIVCIFAGDMEESEEETVLAADYDLKATFLKVGHHGSATSSGEDFLAQVQPEYAAISCGVHNTYGHPAESTLEHLAVWTQNVAITAEQGNIVFLYDKDTKSCSMITSGKADTKE